MNLDHIIILCGNLNNNFHCEFSANIARFSKYNFLKPNREQFPKV